MKRFAWIAAAITTGFLAVTPAHADDWHGRGRGWGGYERQEHEWRKHEWREHGGWRPHYYPPAYAPAYYPPPPVVYMPPPVVVAPPFIGFTIR